MATDGHDIEVPGVVADALQAAAAAVPEADLHPTGPILRLRERRRRRRAATALGGIGAVAAMALTVLAVGQMSPDDEQVVVGDDADGTTTAPTPPPTGPDGTPLLLPRAGAEWLPDGSVRPVPRARPDDVPTDALRLADGRLVTLATRDLHPQEPRVDGAHVGDLAYVMAVFDPDGTLVREKDIRRIGGYIDLAGESEGQVVLSRRQSLGNCCRFHPRVDFSLIDPASFVEEPLIGIDSAYGPADSDDDRLVASSDPRRAEGGRCQLHLVDLGNLADSGDPPPTVGLPACRTVHGVALSPDGDRVAVVTDVVGDEGPRSLELQLHVVDVERGSIVATESLVADPCAPAPGVMCGPLEHRAVTWTDDTTVDVVVQDPDSTVDRTLDLGALAPERLRTVTAVLAQPQS